MGLPSERYCILVCDTESPEGVYRVIATLAPEYKGMDGIVALMEETFRKAIADLSDTLPRDEDGIRLGEVPGRLVPAGIEKMSPFEDKQYSVEVQYPKNGGRHVIEVNAVDDGDAELRALWKAATETFDMDILEDFALFEDHLVDFDVLSCTPASGVAPDMAAFVALYRAATSGQGLDEALEGAREVLLGAALIDDEPATPKF